MYVGVNLVNNRYGKSPQLVNFCHIYLHIFHIKSGKFSRSASPPKLDETPHEKNWQTRRTTPAAWKVTNTKPKYSPILSLPCPCNIHGRASVPPTLFLPPIPPG